MSNPDPTKPTPNSEKFKPQNVADPQSTVEPPSRNGDKPADPAGPIFPAAANRKHAAPADNPISQ